MNDRLAARRRFGFTYLEVVIVVLILGIISAAGVPTYFRSLARFRVEATAKKIVADLRVARRAARTARVNRVVQFDAANNRYELIGLNDMNHSDRDYVIELAKTDYPATLVSADFDGVEAISFDIHGQPHAGAPSSPMASGVVVVRSADEFRSIMVAPITGYAAIQ